MNKIKFLVGVFVISAIFTSCKKDDEPAKSVTFSSSQLAVNVGKSDSVKVSVGVSPFTVVAADNTIATAKVSLKLTNYIVVTGVKEGTTSVTVTDKNNSIGKFNVTIKKAALVFAPTKAEVAVGKTGTVNVSGGSTPYSVSVTDNTIATATVANGVITVTGVKAGTTSITVTDKDLVTAKLDVTIK